jgi:hypothetical protein
MRIALATVTASVLVSAAFGASACAQGPCSADNGNESGQGFTDNAVYGGCGANSGFASTPPSGTPANAPCSTGAWWQGGNEGSEVMHPGVDCVACHAGGEGPSYFLAGTVMGAAHDSDNCQGISNVTIAITDASGAVQTLTTDSAGNFFLPNQVPTPYSVKLTHDSKTAQMITHQTVGACLSCHTAKGANAAPGRIVAP